MLLPNPRRMQRIIRHLGPSIGDGIQHWLVVEPTPLKNHGVKVSWDDDIPN